METRGTTPTAPRPKRKAAPGGTWGRSDQHAAWRHDGARSFPLRSRPARSSLDRRLRRQVKEGNDSTVRPKLAHWEFDQGRRYLDVWAADGKPYFSRGFLSYVRVAKVFCSVTIPFYFVLFAFDGTHGKENIFTPIQRPFWAWWHTFAQLDHADMAKARSVGGALQPTKVERRRREFRQPEV